MRSRLLGAVVIGVLGTAPAGASAAGWATVSCLATARLPRRAAPPRAGAWPSAAGTTGRRSATGTAPAGRSPPTPPIPRAPAPPPARAPQWAVLTTTPAWASAARLWPIPGYALGNDDAADQAIAGPGDGTAFSPSTLAFPASTDRSPSSANPATVLSALSCATSASCAAVGRYTATNGDIGPLAATWNGSTWTQIALRRGPVQLASVFLPHPAVVHGRRRHDRRTLGRLTTMPGLGARIAPPRLQARADRGDPVRVEAEPVHPPRVARVLDLQATVHDRPSRRHPARSAPPPR